MYGPAASTGSLGDTALLAVYSLGRCPEDGVKEAVDVVVLGARCWQHRGRRWFPPRGFCRGDGAGVVDRPVPS